MKSYRSRNLTQKCQVAKTEDGVNPLKDDKGNVVLDFGGLWFLKVSGGENHDRKRVMPQDAQAFFALKAKEIEELLKADGVPDAMVSVEDMYAEYATTYTKPAHTFAPPGQPEEFTLVLPKALCVNWRGSVGTSTGGVRTVATVAPQHTSIFARLKAAKAGAATLQPAAVKKAK